MREPLLHFLALGALVLVLYEWLGPTPADVVRVRAPEVSALERRFVAREGREPSAAEREALVETFVEDEILYREAVALGLDRSDPIVRRRLVQKMRFLQEDLSSLEPATEAELEAFLAAHGDAYRTPDRFTFEHVFVSSARGPEIADELTRLEAALARGEPAQGLGDPFVHGRRFASRGAARLATLFGDGFVDGLRDASVGGWTRLESPFGSHLVRLDRATPGEIPPLDAVRSRVVADWREAAREDAARASMEQLRARYAVRVESGGGS